MSSEQTPLPPPSSSWSSSSSSSSTSSSLFTTTPLRRPGPDIDDIDTDTDNDDSTSILTARRTRRQGTTTPPPPTTPMGGGEFSPFSSSSSSSSSASLLQPLPSQTLQMSAALHCQHHQHQQEEDNRLSITATSTFMDLPLNDDIPLPPSSPSSSRRQTQGSQPRSMNSDNYDYNDDSSTSSSTAMFSAGMTATTTTTETSTTPTPTSTRPSYTIQQPVMSTTLPSSLLTTTTNEEKQQQQQQQQQEECDNEKDSKNDEDERIILGNPSRTITTRSKMTPARMNFHEDGSTTSTNMSVIDVNSEPSSSIPSIRREPPIISIHDDNDGGRTTTMSLDSDSSMSMDAVTLEDSPPPSPTFPTLPPATPGAFTPIFSPPPDTIVEAWYVINDASISTVEAEVSITTAEAEVSISAVQFLICGLSKQWFLRWVLGIILLVTIGMVLGVYFSCRRDIGDVQPTSSPTFSPFDTVIRELGNIITSSDMMITTSISYQAVDWLANNINSNPEISIKEQYAIIILDLSNGGENWNRREEWMSSILPICAWEGIKCSEDSGSNTATITGLFLGSNNLVGSIPSTLGLLTGLTHLYLGYGALTGTIPTQIGQLTKLTRLGLANNALKGKIPTEIGQLTNLVGLGLDDNDLTGTIPTEFGELTNLDWFSPSGNVGLTGDINSIFCDGTEYLGSFSQISVVYISSTQDLNCNCCFVV